jgi:beta-lactamase class C
MDSKIRSIAAAIRPVMAKYNISRVAVVLVIAGDPYVFNYGITSKETRQPVTRGTLFVAQARGQPSERN